MCASASVLTAEEEEEKSTAKYHPYHGNRDVFCGGVAFGGGFLLFPILFQEGFLNRSKILSENGEQIPSMLGSHKRDENGT
jgi:hypothetical protein